MPTLQKLFNKKLYVLLLLNLFLYAANNGNDLLYNKNIVRFDITTEDPIVSYEKIEEEVNKIAKEIAGVRVPRIMTTQRCNNHGCPIDSVQCDPLDEEPLCPNGTLNPITGMCEADPIKTICPDGYQIDKENNLCYRDNIKCPGGGTFNPRKDRCEIPTSYDCNKPVKVAAAGYDFTGAKEHYVETDGVKHNTGRGWQVTILNADWEIEDTHVYDTHGDASKATDMKNYLETVLPNKYIILTTWDEPRDHVSDNANLINEMARFGVTKTLIQNLDYRSAYAFIGKTFQDENNNTVGTKIAEKYEPRYGHTIYINNFADGYYRINENGTYKCIRNIDCGIGTYSNERDRCELVPIYNCYGGSEYAYKHNLSSQANHICELKDTIKMCPDEAPLNGRRGDDDRCERDINSSIDCPTGYTWDKTLDHCVKSVVCPDGGTLNPDKDRCEIKVSELNTCPDDPNWKQITENENYLCVITKDKLDQYCPKSGKYISSMEDVNNKNVAVHRCTLNNTKRYCPDGTYAPNNDLRLCIDSPICPPNSHYDNDYRRCITDVTHTCPPGEYGYNWEYNKTTFKCEAVPMCPDGTDFNTTTNRCERNIQDSKDCPTNYHWDKTLDHCVKSVVCPGAGQLNPDTDRCEYAVELSDSNCDTANGFHWSKTRHRCERDPYCINGGTYDDKYNVCYKPLENLTCPDPDYKYEGVGITINKCVKAPDCGNGTYDSNANTCVGKIKNKCDISNGYTYNSTTKQCERAPKCPFGTKYNDSRNRCEQTKDLSDNCPTGYTWDKTLDHCVKSVVCPDGGTLNPDKDRCEKSISSSDVCPSGDWVKIQEGSKYLCVIKTDKLTDHCPDSGTYSTSYHECIKPPVGNGYSCKDSDYSPDKTKGKCLKIPDCTGADLGYNGNYKKCTDTAKHTCPSSGYSSPYIYTYDSSLMKCTMPPKCNSPFVYDNDSDRCELTVTSAMCPSGTDIEGDKYVYGFNGSYCDKSVNCPYDGEFVGGSTDKCRKAASANDCPAGYTPNDNGKCIKKPICPDGGYYSSSEGKCILSKSNKDFCGNKNRYTIASDRSKCYHDYNENVSSDVTAACGNPSGAVSGTLKLEKTNNRCIYQADLGSVSCDTAHGYVATTTSDGSVWCVKSFNKLITDTNCPVFGDNYKTPNYPNNYGNSYNSSWQHKTFPGASQITMTINGEIEKRHSETDCYDKFYYGKSQSEASSQYICSTQTNRKIIIPGDTVYYKFTSDYDVTKKGYNVDFTFKISNDTSSNYKTPNYPNNYPNNYKPDWQHKTFPGASQIIVTINGTVESGYDYFYVGKSSSDYQRITGSQTNKTVTIDGDTVYYKFTSNDSVTYGGYSVNFKANNNDSVPIHMSIVGGNTDKCIVDPLQTCPAGYSLGAVDGDMTQCQKRVTTQDNCPDGLIYNPATNRCELDAASSNDRICATGTFTGIDNCGSAGTDKTPRITSYGGINFFSINTNSIGDNWHDDDLTDTQINWHKTALLIAAYAKATHNGTTYNSSVTSIKLDGQTCAIDKISHSGHQGSYDYWELKLTCGGTTKDYRWKSGWLKYLPDSKTFYSDAIHDKHNFDYPKVDNHDGGIGEIGGCCETTTIDDRAYAIKSYGGDFWSTLNSMTPGSNTFDNNWNRLTDNTSSACTTTSCINMFKTFFLMGSYGRLSVGGVTANYSDNDVTNYNEDITKISVDGHVLTDFHYIDKYTTVDANLFGFPSKTILSVAYYHNINAVYFHDETTGKYYFLDWYSGHTGYDENAKNFTNGNYRVASAVNSHDGWDPNHITYFTSISHSVAGSCGSLSQDGGICYANPNCHGNAFGNIDNTKDKCYQNNIYFTPPSDKWTLDPNDHKYYANIICPYATSWEKWSSYGDQYAYPHEAAYSKNSDACYDVVENDDLQCDSSLGYQASPDNGYGDTACQKSPNCPSGSYAGQYWDNTNHQCKVNYTNPCGSNYSDTVTNGKCLKDWQCPAATDDLGNSITPTSDYSNNQCYVDTQKSCKDVVVDNYKTPNYPNNYPNNYKPDWQHKTFPGANQITITVNGNAETKGWGDGCWDKFYYGKSSTDFHVICGPQSNKTITIDGDTVYYKFTSDESVTKKGFSVDFKAIAQTNNVYKTLNSDGYCYSEKVSNYDSDNASAGYADVCPEGSFDASIDKCKSSGGSDICSANYSASFDGSDDDGDVCYKNADCSSTITNSYTLIDGDKNKCIQDTASDYCNLNGYVVDWGNNKNTLVHTDSKDNGNKNICYETSTPACSGTDSPKYFDENMYTGRCVENIHNSCSYPSGKYNWNPDHLKCEADPNCSPGSFEGNNDRCRIDVNCHEGLYNGTDTTSNQCYTKDNSGNGYVPDGDNIPAGLPNYDSCPNGDYNSSTEYKECNGGDDVCNNANWTLDKINDKCYTSYSCPGNAGYFKELGTTSDKDRCYEHKNKVCERFTVDGRSYLYNSTKDRCENSTPLCAGSSPTISWKAGNVDKCTETPNYSCDTSHGYSHVTRPLNDYNNVKYHENRCEKTKDCKTGNFDNITNQDTTPDTDKCYKERIISCDTSNNYVPEYLKSGSYPQGADTNDYADICKWTKDLNTLCKNGKYNGSDIFNMCDAGQNVCTDYRLSPIFSLDICAQDVSCGTDDKHGSWFDDTTDMCHHDTYTDNCIATTVDSTSKFVLNWNGSTTAPHKAHWSQSQTKNVCYENDVPDCKGSDSSVKYEQNITVATDSKDYIGICTENWKNDCPSGYTWTDSLDKCIDTPDCPNSGQFDENNDRCKVAIGCNYSSSPKLYNSLENDGANSVCYTGLTDNGNGYVPDGDNIPAGLPNYDSCPNGDYNSSTEYKECNGGDDVCKTNGLSIDRVEDKCYKAVNCGSLEPAAAPNSWDGTNHFYDKDANKCRSKADINCQGGIGYNPATGNLESCDIGAGDEWCKPWIYEYQYANNPAITEKCIVDVNCAGGTYNPTKDRCEYTTEESNCRTDLNYVLNENAHTCYITDTDELTKICKNNENVIDINTSYDAYLTQGKDYTQETVKDHLFYSTMNHDCRSEYDADHNRNYISNVCPSTDGSTSYLDRNCTIETADDGRTMLLCDGNGTSTNIYYFTQLRRGTSVSESTNGQQYTVKNKCEIVPICESGVFNALNNSCFLDDLSCPLGDFECVGEYRDRWCSPYLCDGENMTSGRCGVGKCRTNNVSHTDYISSPLEGKDTSTICAEQNCDLAKYEKLGKCQDTECPKGFGVYSLNGHCYKDECPNGSTVKTDGKCYEYKCPDGTTEQPDGKCR